MARNSHGRTMALREEKTQMLFLGTGAAEGFPDPFCGCEACLAAEKSDDPKLKRRRSALLLNEETLIDFGPDVMFACAAYGASLRNLRHMFLTHSHEDHFSCWNLAYMGMSQTWGDRRIALYMSREARGLIEQFIAWGERCGHPDVENQLRNTEKYYEFVTVEPFRTYHVDDMNVMAVYGRHDGFAAGEKSLNYYFETPRQGNVFYASDTGRVYDETYDALKGKRLDTLIIEGSFGKKPLGQENGHLWQETLCEALDRLIAQSTITSATQIYVTHIAHHGRYTHYDYEAYLQARYGERIHVAYDGLRV